MASDIPDKELSRQTGYTSTSLNGSPVIPSTRSLTCFHASPWRSLPQTKRPPETRSFHRDRLRSVRRQQHRRRLCPPRRLLPSSATPLHPPRRCLLQQAQAPLPSQASRDPPPSQTHLPPARLSQRCAIAPHFKRHFRSWSRPPSSPPQVVVLWRLQRFTSFHSFSS